MRSTRLAIFMHASKSSHFEPSHAEYEDLYRESVALNRCTSMVPRTRLLAIHRRQFRFLHRDIARRSLVSLILRFLCMSALSRTRTISALRSNRSPSEIGDTRSMEEWNPDCKGTYDRASAYARFSFATTR